MIDDNFQTMIKTHMDRYIVLKQSKQYEEAMKELEMIISLMSKAITTIFGRTTETRTSKLLDTFPKPNKYVLQNLNNLPVVTTNIKFEDAINPNNKLTIDQRGNLKLKRNLR